MRISRERIERAFREGHWREWRRTAIAIAPWLAAISAIIAAWAAWIGFWPSHDLGYIRGRLEDLQVGESDTGTFANATVRFADGSGVHIAFPQGLLFRRGAEVEVRCVGYEQPFRRRRCYFNRYVE